MYPTITTNPQTTNNTTILAHAAKDSIAVTVNHQCHQFIDQYQIEKEIIISILIKINKLSNFIVIIIIEMIEMFVRIVLGRWLMGVLWIRIIMIELDKFVLSFIFYMYSRIRMKWISLKNISMFQILKTFSKALCFQLSSPLASPSNIVEDFLSALDFIIFGFPFFDFTSLLLSDSLRLAIYIRNYLLYLSI